MADETKDKDRLDLIERSWRGLDPVSPSSFGISRRGLYPRDGENNVSADTYINALFREAGQAGLARAHRLLHLRYFHKIKLACDARGYEV